MSTSENDRLDLRQAFEQMFEDKRIADIAMNALPPIDYAQLASKQDLALQSAELRADMAELKGEMRSGMAGLKGEFTSLRGEFESLSGQLKAAHAENLKVLVLAIVSATVILGGLIASVLG